MLHPLQAIDGSLGDWSLGNIFSNPRFQRLTPTSCIGSALKGLQFSYLISNWPVSCDWWLREPVRSAPFQREFRFGQYSCQSFNVRLACVVILMWCSEKRKWVRCRHKQIDVVLLIYSNNAVSL